MDHNEKKKIRNEMDPVVIELMKHGVQHNTTEEEMTGLGDLVESTLQKFGIPKICIKAIHWKPCNVMPDPLLTGVICYMYEIIIRCCTTCMP